MNQENDNLENLLGYLRKFCLDFFENSQIDCNVEFSEITANLNLSQSVKRNLLLVIKETLHNILKHSEASSIVVEVELKDTLIISILENGNGFDIKNLRTYGNGLKNMKKRMQEIGGIFEINSMSGKGSLTKLMLNLK